MEPVRVLLATSRKDSEVSPPRVGGRGPVRAFSSRRRFSRPVRQPMLAGIDPPRLDLRIQSCSRLDRLQMSSVSSPPTSVPFRMSFSRLVAPYRASGRGPDTDVSERSTQVRSGPKRPGGMVPVIPDRYSRTDSRSGRFPMESGMVPETPVSASQSSLRPPISPISSGMVPAKPFPDARMLSRLERERTASVKMSPVKALPSRSRVRRPVMAPRVVGRVPPRSLLKTLSSVRPVRPARPAGRSPERLFWSARWTGGGGGGELGCGGGNEREMDVKWDMEWM